MLKAAGRLFERKHDMLFWYYTNYSLLKQYIGNCIY